MKTKKLIKYTNLALFALMLCCSNNLWAQKNKVKKTEVSSVVKDASGNVISGAIIYANEGAFVTKSDANGYFSVKAEQGSTILIEADGYVSYIWSLSEMAAKENLILVDEDIMRSEDDKVILPMKVSVDQYNLVGAVSKINGADLERYTDPLLTNTLQGMAPGLMVNMTEGGMANNSADVFVRGLARNSNSAPIYLVDGIERDYEDLNPEEIETIEILKDASAKILYGSRAANGVVLITTRRGESFKRVIDAKVDFGVGLVTRMPEFLNSYDYATLYNEACENDGVAKLYSDDDLEGYANSTGENDLLYPDADYYDYFLRNYTTYQKATVNVSGGNKNAKYAFMGGYMGYRGLQKIGLTPSQDRFNIRANLDMDITNYASAYVNISAIIDSWEYSGLNHWDTFNALSTHRPNEYPFVISEDYIAAEDDGTPALGGSYTYPTNLLGSMLYSGDGNDQFINQQMTTGLDFDLSALTDGLKAGVAVSFDNYFYGQQKVKPSPSTYAVVYDPTAGADSISFDQVKVGADDDEYNLTANETSRTTSFSAKLSYDKAFSNGVLAANAGFYYYLKENSGSTQDIENDNIYLRGNYIHNNKYVIDGTMAYMGSNRYIDSERRFLSTAVGAAWIVSEEDFMSGDVFDFLKLKASFGILGYDAQTSHYLYENRWKDGSTASFGEKNAGEDADAITVSSWGNSSLGWEKAREINVGIEGLAFDRHLVFEANYFNEYRYDMVDVVGSSYSAISGSFTSSSNYEAVSNQGVELGIHWMDQIGDLSYKIGLNATYAKNVFSIKDEVDYPEWRQEEGKATNVIMGYESLGLFGKDIADIDAHADQSAVGGSYGEGDIAYKDQNDDGVINELDKVDIGVDAPTTQLGITVDLKYKGFGLYMLGTSSLGVTKELTNTYYQNFGESKYSVLAKDRYHVDNNPGGNQPSLTTTEGANNTVSSDFWTESGNFFRLKNVELSYTLDFKPASSVKSSKFFVRGNNLFVLSNIDDLDPEAPNGGVTNYPVLRMITGGVSVSF
jgi:TonB-linked SusC/RagA family outer membrane protein